MDSKLIVDKSKNQLTEIAGLIAAGKTKEGYTQFGSLVKELSLRDPRLAKLLAGLVVSSVQARKNPRAFEDPLTAFEDPLTAFEDPLTAFEDPLTAFDDRVYQRMDLSLIGQAK